MEGWEHWTNKLHNGRYRKKLKLDEYGACISKLGHGVIVDVYIRSAIRPLKKTLSPPSKRQA